MKLYTLLSINQTKFFKVAKIVKTAAKSTSDGKQSGNDRRNAL